jgi:hypothetical protein
LRCYDKKDMVKDHDFGRYESESLVGRDQYDLGEDWTKANKIIDEVFMLHQSMNEFQKSSCETDHIGVG